MSPLAGGETWGEARPLPEDGIVVRSDWEAAALVAEARRAGSPPPALGLLGGDLCRTLGGRGDHARLYGPDAATFAVDLGIARIADQEHCFLAHLVARRTWLRGEVLAVMNTEWLGDWRLAPRAHPGDGALDVLEANPPLRDRLAALRRLPSGDHLPHPDITMRRAASVRASFRRTRKVWIDGVCAGRADGLEVTLLPSAVSVVV